MDLYGVPFTMPPPISVPPLEAEEPGGEVQQWGGGVPQGGGGGGNILKKKAIFFPRWLRRLKKVSPRVAGGTAYRGMGIGCTLIPKRLKLGQVLSGGGCHVGGWYHDPPHSLNTP